MGGFGLDEGHQVVDCVEPIEEVAFHAERDLYRNQDSSSSQKFERSSYRHAVIQCISNIQHTLGLVPDRHLIGCVSRRMQNMHMRRLGNGISVRHERRCVLGQLDAEIRAKRGVLELVGSQEGWVVPGREDRGIREALSSHCTRPSQTEEFRVSIDMTREIED